MICVEGVASHNLAFPVKSPHVSESIKTTILISGSFDLIPLLLAGIKDMQLLHKANTMQCGSWALVVTKHVSLLDILITKKKKIRFYSKRSNMKYKSCCKEEKSPENK